MQYFSKSGHEALTSLNSCLIFSKKWTEDNLSEISQGPQLEIKFVVPIQETIATITTIYIIEYMLNYKCIKLLNIILDKKSRLKYIRQESITSTETEVRKDVRSATSLCRLPGFYTSAKYVGLDEAVQVVHNNMYNMVKEELYPSKKDTAGSSFGGFQFDLDFPELEESSDSEDTTKEQEDELKHSNKEEQSVEDVEYSIQESLLNAELIKPEKSIPKLKEFCRWEIRHRLGLNVMELAGELPLPTKLRDYVLMSELSEGPVYIELFQHGCYYGCLFGCMHGVSIKDLLK